MASMGARPYKRSRRRQIAIVVVAIVCAEIGAEWGGCGCDANRVPLTPAARAVQSATR